MQSECTIRLNKMNNIGRENDCASTLSDHQLLELGRLVCFNNDGLFALIDKLNVNQPGIGQQPDPGYRVLKAWINKGSGTTLRFLRTVFKEMLRIDLVNMLDDFIKGCLKIPVQIQILRVFKVSISLSFIYFTLDLIAKWPQNLFKKI